MIEPYEDFDFSLFDFRVSGGKKDKRINFSLCELYLYSDKWDNSWHGALFMIERYESLDKHGGVYFDFLWLSQLIRTIKFKLGQNKT